MNTLRADRSSAPMALRSWRLPIVAALLAVVLIPMAQAQQPGGTPDDAAARSQNAEQDSALDATASSDPAATPETKSFWQIVFSGGWSGIVIMTCLIALSLTAAYLVFDQILSLRRKDLLPEGLSDGVRQMMAAGRSAEAVQLCQQQPSLLAFVLLHGLEEAEGGWSEVEKAMEDALAEQSARLFRKVEYLSVIGNLAPMLGLLGTVTGMIIAFEQVASTQGSAGAADLAEGIYEALVTTVAGLVIAIPALGAFAVFRNKVDELISEAAYLAHHALSPLKRRATARITPTRTAPPPPPREGAR